MQKDRTLVRLGAAARGAGTAFVLSLMAASGCADEVGGDGYQPPRPTSGGLASSGGALEAEGGAAGDQGTMTAGRGGKGGNGGHAGKTSGGTGGTVIITEGGAGGAEPGSSCGNGQTEPGEECDDGNTKSGDGCTADCKSGCEVCEKTYCKAVRSATAGDYGWASPDPKKPLDPFTNCATLPLAPTSGPGKDVPRAELCQAMVDCIRRENCAQLVADDFGNFSPAKDRGFFRCFCDRDVTEPSYLTNCAVPPPATDDPNGPPHFIEGKCKQEIWEASERDKLGEVLLNPNNLSSALGAANTLLQACDKKLCTEECVPRASVGVVAQISADILTLANDAGESPLGDLLADSQRAALSTDFALVNGSALSGDYAAAGFIYGATPGRPADADGRLLESEVRNVLFGMEPTGSGVNIAGGNKLATLQLKGQEIYAVLNAVLPGLGALQVSGLEYTWDASQPATARVTEVRKGGAIIDMAATFSVAANNVLAKAIVDLLFAKNPDLEAVTSEKEPERELVAYLQSLPQPVAPPELNRIKRSN